MVTTFLNYHAGYFSRVWRGQHHVYAEGLVGKAAGLSDLLPYGLGAAQDGGNDAKASGVGDGGGQAGIGNPRHTSLEDGLFNSHKVAKGCPYHLLFLFLRSRIR